MHPWASGFRHASREWPLQRWIELISRANGLGLLCFSMSDLRGFGRGVLLEWLPFIAILIAYDSLRGSAAHTFGVHYLPQLQVDRWFFGGTAPTVTLQHWLWHGHVVWYDVPVWAVYLTHFFATRPLTDAALAGTLLRTAAVSLGLGFAVLAVGLGLGMAICFKFIERRCGAMASRGNTATPRPAATMLHIASKLRTWMRSFRLRPSACASVCRRCASEVPLDRLTISYSMASAKCRLRRPARA